MLHAGMLGVRDKVELKAKDMSVPPASLDEKRRVEMGITKRLPLNLEEARENLVNDAELVEFFTKDVVEKYLAVNKVCFHTHIRGD